MATYYSHAVIEPALPDALVSSTDLEMLQGSGFRWEWHEGHYYFYAEEYSEFGHLDIEDAREWLRSLEDDYPEDAPRPEWVLRMIRILEEAAEEDGAVDLEPGEDGIDCADVLQGMLNKPANAALEKPLEEIWIGGATTCSRPLPGAYGGWCVWIRPDRLDHLSTHGAGELFERLDRVRTVLGQLDEAECLAPALRAQARQLLAEL